MRGGGWAGLVAALWLAAGIVHADARPDAALGDVEGTVHALLEYNGTLYLGGGFTAVFDGKGTRIDRNHLAAVDLATGDVLPWNPDVNGVVRALALSPDGRTLYIGGDFTSVTGQPRNYLAALDTTSTSNALLPWNPDADAVVRALLLSADGRIVYAGGDFGSLGGGSVTRARLAALDAVSGVPTPWAPQADGPVETLLAAGDGLNLYAGGGFTLVGGQPRNRLARLSLSSGLADAWDPAPDATVRSLALAGDVLYVGGDFTTVDGQARSRIAALDTTASAPGGIVTSWSPAFDGPVWGLALSGDGRILYVGGDFGTANGATPRSRLAALDTASAALTPWDPGADLVVRAVASDGPAEHLYVGGDFTDIASDPSSAPRTGLAAFAIGPPVTTATPPAGGYQTPQTVTLSCVDNGGAPCTAVYVTTDGSQPQAIPAHLYGGGINVSADTTLRFFGVDAEGNLEPERRADYFIDSTAPTVSASLPGGAYGGVTLKKVVLLCDDGNGSGCSAIRYTTDGSAPDGGSTLFTAPIDLAAQINGGAGQVTLRFFAVDGAGNQSAEGKEVYDLDVEPPVVTASLPDGTYPPPQTVTLVCNDGSGTGCVAIHYTTDGSVPSDGTVLDSDGNLIPASPLYTAPLVLETATMLNVLSVDRAGNKNTQLVGIYAFTRPRDQDNTIGAVGPLSLLAVVLAWLGRRLSGGSGAWR